MNHPARWPKGHKYERTRAEKDRVIANNMAQMPKWLAEAKERKRLPDDISLLDRYILSNKQLYNKYVKSRPRK